MRKLKRLLAFMIILTPLLSCNSENKGREIFAGVVVATKKMDIPVIGRSEILMVINMQGCSVCYSRALYFLENNIEVENVNYINTGIQSKKNLRIRLGKDVVDNDKVYLDTKNYLYASGVKKPYPLIFYLSNQELEKLVIADIQSAEVYNELSNYLDSRN